MHRLPIQSRFERYIRDGSKDVEGRVDSGRASSIEEGDVLVLGCARSKVVGDRSFVCFEESAAADGRAPGAFQGAPAPAPDGAAADDGGRSAEKAELA